jgi:hypothetical protein
MTDLVKRLRDWIHVYPEDYDKDAGHLYEEAAARIEALEAEVVKAREEGRRAGLEEVAKEISELLDIYDGVGAWDACTAMREIEQFVTTLAQTPPAGGEE